MIEKYTSDIEPDYWYSKQISKDLIELLVQHRSTILIEIEEVKAGTRKLKKLDFLGPKEREERKKSEKLEVLAKILKEKGAAAHARALSDFEAKEKQDYSEFFNDLNTKILDHRVNSHKKEVHTEARKRDRKLQ